MALERVAVYGGSFNPPHVGHVLACAWALSTGEVERVLTALQFMLESTPWGWTVTTPSTRLDIQAGAADLIEELARVSGYDRLPERLLPLEMPTPKGNRSLAVEQRMQDVLAQAQRETQDSEAREALSRAGVHYRKMRDEIVRALGIS